MILEHEIPTGSKLYFGASAKKKREIENIASQVLFDEGFEEIVTPIFSYHQHQSIADESELVRVSDKENNMMSLRADSTIDVVKIITKRVARTTDQKKWFYVQPVFRAPSCETYQVGAEFINHSNLLDVLDVNMKIFNKLELEPLLQLCNIKIPQIICEELDLELDDFKLIKVDKFLSLGIEWLSDLVYLETLEDLEKSLPKVPEKIRVELEKLKDLASKVEYKNLVLSPLYYSKMLYYNDVFYRVIEKNEIFARGGTYESDEITSVGFAINTDTLI